MNLRLLAKDENSGRAGCPSVYIDDDGWAVVQGPEVETRTREALVNLLPGETGVRIAPSVLAAAVARHRRE
ncbi:hypothetical protein [Pseudonocardia sp. HH130630-07]|uniref:hypothetical protein n=1 Tax=Pseudonocardia sp. HH130630-07 TaxID=1690815 RepID=UPI0008151734|nr:hypothetical protein [Pseudonocardia sp. HH130630-07]ANY08063.1 hypothetical protein AFB00_19180 [Pseudonocardia sp. HH130630-07]